MSYDARLREFFSDYFDLSAHGALFQVEIEHMCRTLIALGFFQSPDELRKAALSKVGIILSESVIRTLEVKQHD